MPTAPGYATLHAKLRCHSVRIVEGQKSYQGPMTDPTTEVHLSAVYGDGSDNASWSKETPQGFVKMVITNPDASAAFVAGQDYFLDFTPVQPAASTEDGTMSLPPVPAAEATNPAAPDRSAPTPSPEPAPAQAA